MTSTSPGMPLICCGSAKEPRPCILRTARDGQQGQRKEEVEEKKERKKKTDEETADG